MARAMGPRKSLKLLFSAVLWHVEIFENLFCSKTLPFGSGTVWVIIGDTADVHGTHDWQARMQWGYLSVEWV